jgi:Flp pilus assembly protein TadD
LGVIYRDSGNRLEQAVAELETAVKLSPRQPAFFNELGVAYRQAGQFDKARQAYEQAVTLDPNGAAAVLNLGILLDLYLADGARALPLYERYLALSPQGDAAVGKWIADLKNRKPAPAVAKEKKE